MFKPTLDFFKNGDGVYELPSIAVVGPCFSLLTREEKKPVVAGYITFATKTLPPPKRGCARPPKKKKDPFATERLRAWLIASIKYEQTGKSTELSCKLQAACIDEITKRGIEVWPIVAPLYTSKKEKVTALAPVSKSTSWKLYKDGWYMKDDGAFVRTGTLDTGVNQLHIGTSVKASSHMSQKEQMAYDNFVTRRLVEEVHCG